MRIEKSQVTVFQLLIFETYFQRFTGTTENLKNGEHRKEEKGETDRETEGRKRKRNVGKSEKIYKSGIGILKLRIETSRLILLAMAQVACVKAIYYYYYYDLFFLIYEL